MKGEDGREGGIGEEGIVGGSHWFMGGLGEELVLLVVELGREVILVAWEGAGEWMGRGE